MKTELKQKNQRRSKEEIFLAKLEKEKLQAIRLEEKKARDELKQIQKEEKLKPEPTEEELVHRYVNRVIRNSQYHGRVDTEKFSGLEYEKTISKNLWMDTDFYFSVVFQSKQQKFEFLEKWEQIHPSLVGEKIESLEKFKIINGLMLAKALGITLSQESTRQYPTGSIDLMPYVMDDISINR